MWIFWGQTLNNKFIIWRLSNYPTNQIIYPYSLEEVLSFQRIVYLGELKYYPLDFHKITTFITFYNELKTLNKTVNSSILSLVKNIFYTILFNLKVSL